MVCLDSSSRRRVLCTTLLFVVSSVMVPPSEPLLLRSSLRLQHHEPADNSPVAIATRGIPSGAILPDLLEKHSPGQASLLQGPDSGEDKDEENEFNLNVGRALDYLAQDVPQMFSAPPRLEIFTQGVVLKDPVGELCHGKRLYGALHTSLRVLSAVTAATPRVGVTSIAFNQGRREVELKWNMLASAPLIGEDAVKISVVSLYRINERGLIFEHALDNRIKRDLWEYSHSWMGVLVSGCRPPSG